MPARERLFSAAVESSNDAIITQSLDGLITGWNPAAERLFGYTAAEAVGRHIALIVPADRLGEVDDIVRRISWGETIEQNETVRLRKDGTSVEVALSISPIKAASGAIIGISKTARDITERNRTQRALQQQIEERRRIFETSQDLILVTNARGILVQVSPSSAAILGYSPEEMLGRSALDFTHAEDVERANQEARAEGAGTTDPKLYLALRAQGRTDRDAVMDGDVVRAGQAVLLYRPRHDRQPQGAGGSARERANGARHHRDLARRLRAGRPARRRQGLERAGRDPLRLVPRGSAGTELFEMMGRPGAPGPLQMALEGFLRSGAEQIRQPRREIQARRRDGEQFTAELSVTALKIRDGFVFNSFIRDLTDKVATEERIRQAEKMEAMGQLTGGIAHDFNNILTVITGTIEILADAVKEEPQLAAITQMIDEAASRGADLTQHLLAFARKQPLEPRETDVNGLIIETAKLLQRTLGEQVEIESVFAEETCPAIVDPNQLATALLNLALNARDAMPDGGKLVIETGLVVLDENYARITGDVRPGSYAMIAVSDTGTGIPAGIIDRVFDPFFTSKGPGKGTGLGLSMVYGFIKQSAGHIRIYSEEGHGTTVKMYLPPASRASLTAEPTLAPELVGGHETILVVEDDKLVRDYVLTQLHSLGYVTLDAANASEALAMVKSGAAFDLLFTDVIMPGLNGRQLADEILKIMPGLKVLFTSGYTENAIIHHGRLDAGVLLLAKPYRKSDMAIMIRKALAE